MEVDSGKGL